MEALILRDGRFGSQLWKAVSHQWTGKNANPLVTIDDYADFEAPWYNSWDSFLAKNCILFCEAACVRLADLFNSLSETPKASWLSSADEALHLSHSWRFDFAPFRFASVFSFNCNPATHSIGQLQSYN
jgi:hypothetical protein